MADEMKTPLLDDLEKGPWPSFVKDMKQAEKAGEDAARAVVIYKKAVSD